MQSSLQQSAPSRRTTRERCRGRPTFRHPVSHLLRTLFKILERVLPLHQDRRHQLPVSSRQDSHSYGTSPKGSTIGCLSNNLPVREVTAWSPDHDFDRYLRCPLPINSFRATRPDRHRSHDVFTAQFSLRDRSGLRRVMTFCSEQPAPVSPSTSFVFLMIKWLKWSLKLIKSSFIPKWLTERCFFFFFLFVCFFFLFFFFFFFCFCFRGGGVTKMHKWRRWIRIPQVLR